MIVNVPVVGKGGLLVDPGVSDMPPDSFTDVLSVRFRDGLAETMRGDEELSNGGTTNQLAANFTMTFGDPGTLPSPGSLNDWTDTGGGGTLAHNFSATVFTYYVELATTAGNSTDLPGVYQSIDVSGVASPFTVTLTLIEEQDYGGTTASVGTTQGGSELFSETTPAVVGSSSSQVVISSVIYTDVDTIYLQVEAIDNGNAAGFVRVKEFGITENQSAPRQVFYGDDQFLAMSVTKASAVAQGVAAWSDVTKAGGYNTRDFGDSGQWTGEALNNNIIVTNYMDPPQQWDSSTIDPTADLENWMSSRWTCKSIRNFRSYLIALNLREYSTDVAGSAIAGTYPHRVKWSHPAIPGALPVTWDETDPTKDAGEYDLPGTDIIVDGGTLRDLFVIYKERSTWSMQYIGGQNIFRFTQLFSEHGALTTNCWAELEGQHVVLTSSDLIIHGGSNPKSLLDGRIRRWLFDNIDRDNMMNCFVTKAWFFNEIWACFPSLESDGTPDRAVVYNWKQGTVSVRELPGFTGAALGATADRTEPDYSNELQKLVMAYPIGSALVQADTSDTDVNGVALDGSLERTGLTFSAPQKRKFVRGIRPRFGSGDGSTVTIEVGYHNSVDDVPTWSSPKTFTVGTDFKCDYNVEGRYIAVRILSVTGAWRLESLDFDLDMTGDY